MERHIKITGLGAIGSFGIGVESLFHALQQGVNTIHLSKHYPELSFALLQAELEGFDLTQALQCLAIEPKLAALAAKCVRRSSLVVQTGVCAAMEAWQQAMLTERIASTRIGIIAAGHNTTSYEQYQMQKEHGDDLHFINPSYALNFMDSQQLSVLSEILAIRGPGMTIGDASASSHAALYQAYQWVQQGHVDACIVVGSLARLAPIELQALYNLGALGGRSFVDNPQAACRPFDKAHEGFIPGQAAACVIIEAAEKPKALAGQVELLGAALRLDANHLANPNLSGEVKVMQQALTAAGLTAADIDYINAHATSTPLGDKIELRAIERVFKGQTTDTWVNSTKSITGHCLWSAGLIETIATVLQLQNQFIHANVNLANPIAAPTSCRLVGQQAIAAKLDYAMNNGFGFGGVNSSLILARR